MLLLASHNLSTTPHPVCDFAMLGGWRLATMSSLLKHSISPHPLGGACGCQTWLGCQLQVQTRLEVIIRGQVLKEVALLLHDAVELVNVNLTIAVTLGLVDHVLELLIVNVLTELLS